MLGLDWGNSSSLKYVLLRRTAVGFKLQVETFGRVAVAAEASEAVYEISQALHELFMREKRFKKAKIVIGLGTDKVVLKKESLSPLSAKELRQALEFGIRKDLGLEGEDTQVVFDSLVLGPDPTVQGNTEYLCFGAETRLISERAAAVSEQGVIPVKIIPNILAVKNLHDQLLKAKSAETVCFLEIGAIRSLLIFFRKGQVDFYREIVIGGDDFTKAITGTIFHEGRAIQFTNKEALEFKHKHGYPLGFSDDMTFRGAPLSEVGAMMRPVVERLTGEIHRSIGFYSEKTGGGSINALYMTGGGAQLKHLSQVLTERLGIPTSVMPFPSEIRVSGGMKQEQLFRSRYLEYASALALALETNSKGNLLPREFVKLHTMALIQRCLSWAAVLLLLVVGIFSGLDFMSLKSLKKLRADREKTAAVVAKKVNRYEKSLHSKTELATQIVRLDEKIRQNPAGLDVLKLITVAAPKSLSLISVRIGVDQEAAAVEAKAKSRSRSRSKTEDSSAEKDNANTKPVRIEGRSKLSIPDIRISVAQFMLALSKSGYLTDVKLQDENLDESKDEYLFVIEGTAIQ